MAMNTPAEVFYESRIHKTHRVLGVRLRPLCLLDIIALEAIGSPLACGGALSKFGLLTAVSILSRPHRKDLTIDPEIAKPSRYLTIRLLFCNFERELAKLEAYIRDHVTEFRMWSGSSASGNPFGAHWIQSRIAFLLNNTNLTQAEILAGPFSNVLAISTALHEQLSDSRIVSERDIQLERELDEGGWNAANAKLKREETERLEAKLTAGTISKRELDQLSKLKGVSS